MPTESDINAVSENVKPLKKQLPRFLVSGCLAVATDFLTYYALLEFMSHAPAKTLSFISGTVLAYILNKYWTFEKNQLNHFETIRFIILYSTTLGANVLVNQTTLHFFPTFLLLAFLLATGTSTVLNFIGQKWWVFKA